MANPKDDASTNIATVAANFAKDATAEAAKLRKTRLDLQKKGTKDAKNAGQTADDEIPVITFAVGQGKTSGVRTPAEQAQLLIAGSSKVCWSAHMSDKARDLIMKLDGKVNWDAKKAFGEDFASFKKKWGELLKKHGLKNAAGGDGWPSWDEFHVELPDAKISLTDQRAGACIDEYVRLTRQESKKQNAEFEKTYGKLIEYYTKKYTPKQAGQ
jgi:hypothetical protein